MIVLGIETSCDDTSVAVVKDGTEILVNLVSSQDAFHRRFSGVVPEIASRKHLETVHLLVRQALEESGLSGNDIDRIAVTNRPGLIGSLLVGVSAAKAYAWLWQKPLVPVNHMAAHLYSPAFEHNLSYPLLGLIVSGGHTLLLRAENPVEFSILGSTIDDAVGEVYDKIAKYFELGYPGGPVIDRLAGEGNKDAYAFPRTLLDPVTQRLHFSFSGIKTAVIHQRARFCAATASGPGAGGSQKGRQVGSNIKSNTKSNTNNDANNDVNNKNKKNNNESIADIAASFQKAVVDVLESKVKRAVEDTGLSQVLVSGGVAANGYLRERFAACPDFQAVFPSRRLCTDNAAMVAGLGFHSSGELVGEDMLKLDVASRIVLRGKRRSDKSNKRKAAAGLYRTQD